MVLMDSARVVIIFAEDQEIQCITKKPPTPDQCLKAGGKRVRRCSLQDERALEYRARKAGHTVYMVALLAAHLCRGPEPDVAPTFIKSLRFTPKSAPRAVHVLIFCSVWSPSSPTCMRKSETAATWTLLCFDLSWSHLAHT